MRLGLLAATLLVASAAGCAAPQPAAPPADGAPERMRVAGLVESDTLVPLANATVAIAELNLTVRTDGLGAFAFPPLAPRVYSVEASLEGYRSTVLVARPETNPGALDFVLQRALPPAPRQDQFRFRGSLDCGGQTPLATGSCDGGAGAFGNQTAFAFPLAAGWRTAVVDVVFDPEAHPGLGGLRLLVRGQGPADHAGTRQEIGRFNGSQPFTARLEPGRAAADGAAPVDANLTRVLLDVSPQGRLDGQACAPATPAGPGGCLGGAGAGVNVEFDLYVTVFYIAPAPAGYTLRMDA